MTRVQRCVTVLIDARFGRAFGSSAFDTHAEGRSDTFRPSTVRADSVVSTRLDHWGSTAPFASVSRRAKVSAATTSLPGMACA